MNSSDASTKRADELAAEAAQSITKKDAVRAANLAREALSLDPRHAKAHQILQTLQTEEATSGLPDLCIAFVQHGDDARGNEALQYLKQQPRLTDDEATQCANELLLHRGKPSAVNDDLTASILAASPAARKVLAHRLTEQPTNTFLLLWDRGDRSINAITATILDITLWSSSKEREQAVQDVFQLALGELLAPGQDFAERAMTVVARLLASESKILVPLIDADTFEIIVPYLDIRLPASMRSQATLAMVKLLEMTKDIGEQHLAHFVKFHINRGRNEDFIIAFSAATAAFPIVPKSAATLFLTEGFLPSLIPTLQRNEMYPEDQKSHKLEHAALELFSAACVDKDCRGAVSKYAGTWLQDLAEASLDSESAGLAALVLAKISKTETEDNQPRDAVALSSILANMTLNASNDAERQSSIEGLAYTSLDGNVKEAICRNEKLLRTLTQTLKDKESNASAVYGCLTVLANVTTYRPTESEEQKKMTQLKAYANASKPGNDDASEDDAHVTARCRKVLDAEIVPELAIRSKSASIAVLTAIVQIIYSLAKEQKHRGTMAQQGAVRALLQSIIRLEDTSMSSLEQAGATKHTATHGLARILISTNPNHVFSSSLPAASALRPLISLLSGDSQPSPSLLPTFESLLALTNLASMEDDSIRNSLVRSSWTQIEDLLLNSNTLVQRATVELVCNLMASPHCVALFADGSKAAGNRMHILLALADAEDLATRRAAGGALAMLTEWDEAVKAVLSKERGVKIVLGMCEDDNDEMKHRGLACLLNIVTAPDPVGQEALNKVNEEHGADILKKTLTATKNPQVLQIGVEALKKILGQT